MPRTALLALAIALPVVAAAQAAKKSAVADPLPVGSVWVGTGEQGGTLKGKDHAHLAWGTMVLHVDERTGSFFKASAWYPGLNCGVGRMSGVLDDKGGISIEEPSILFGQGANGVQGLAPGGRWTGHVDATSLAVTGSFEDQASKAEIPCRFSLVRSPASQAAAALPKEREPKKKEAKAAPAAENEPKPKDAEASPANEPEPKPKEAAAKKPNPKATVHRGEWEIKDGVLVGRDADLGQYPAFLAFGELSWQEYDWTVKVQASTLENIPADDKTGAALRVHVRSQVDWFQVAFAKAAGVTRRIKDEWKHVKGSPAFLELDRWYEVKFVVRGASVQTFVDGAPLVAFESETFVSGQLGIQCQNARVRCKDITVTDPSGRVLWQGLPTIR